MTYQEATTFLFTSLPLWEQKGAGAYKPGLERIASFTAALGLNGIYSRGSGNATIPVRESLSAGRNGGSESAGAGSGHNSHCVNDSLRESLSVEGRNAPAPHAVGMHPVPTIHVAGTNGKGSVSHMLAAVLQSAGYRTGLFTSPHLVDFRERIRIDGEPIPRQAVVEFTETWRGEMVRLGLTFFEMATAMALWWFSRKGCSRNADGDSMLRNNVDVAVIEAGLGGRLDSTNIITPVLSVITNIGLEHTQYLGDTIAKIAAEKAGIIKPGVPVVIGETDPESAPVFRAKAAESGSPIVFADQIPAETLLLAKEEYPERKAPGEVVDITLDLAGDYQQKNLQTVLSAVDRLRQTFEISDDALRRGLAHAASLTGLRGRWEVLQTAPLVVCDTAHNAHGLAEVARQLAHQNYENLYMVLGFAADKDLDAIIPLLPRDAHYILTQASTPRAMPAEELANHFSASAHLQISESPNLQITKTVAEAIKKALSLASPRDMVYIGGSNFVVGEALPCFDC